MQIKSVEAQSLVKKMRGGAQAHLLTADDGNSYVVKFTNNPQHRRVLVNELVASMILKHLGISTPEVAMIQVTPEFLAAQPDVHFTGSQRRSPVQPGRHLASRYPGDPNRTSVFDFLPDSILPYVINREDFLGILAFDKWTANTDGRQCIFFRSQQGLVVNMIDHGGIFNGGAWDFQESSIQGLYARRTVYDSVQSLEDFTPWLERVVNFPEEVIFEAWKAIPREWIAGDEIALERLLGRLLRRRERVPDLVAGCRSLAKTPFRNWTRPVSERSSSSALTCVEVPAC